LNVTVIERCPHSPARVPEEDSPRRADRHAEAGVTIVNNAKIARIDSDSILLEDGRQIPATVLIARIGAAPAIQLGEAAGSGSTTARLRRA